MKRIKFLFGLTVLAIGLFSCSKNYTCSCTSTYADGASMTTEETVTFKAKTLSDANGNCGNMNESYNGINTTYARNCTAKLK